MIYARDLDRSQSGPSPAPERRPSPRQLWMLGSAMLAAMTLGGAALGWWAMARMEAGIDRMAATWRNADGVMEMTIGSLQTDRAMHLADQGLATEAEQARRDGVTAFRSQIERVRNTGLSSPADLQAIERLFGELEALARDKLQNPPAPGGDAAAAPAAPDRAAAGRLTSTEGELNTLLATLEGRGDDGMEHELAHTARAVRHAMGGLVVLVLGIALVALAGGALLLRWVLRKLDHPVHQIALSTGQLREAAQYQVRSAAEQSAATVQISSTMQELLASYRNMTQKSRDMVQTSKMAAEECHKGHTFLTQSQKGIGHIKVEVGRIADHMRTLEEKSRQINSVLEIINEMASQTNLLSINATIEAAGAGEAGRRFAVVAEEIRLLAERAVESTEEIRTLIEDIQETVQVTNSVTADGERAVDRGLEDVGKIAENFDTLLSLVTQTADAVQLIEAAAQEQGRAVQQVTDAVESLSHISSETERHSGDTLETVKNLSYTAQELESMASLRVTREA
jgi:methyl-accepting chemotaxis protein